MIADAVLGVIGVVGVRRPVLRFHLAVVARTGVLVRHQQRNRRPERLTIEDTRQDLTGVALTPLSGKPALARPPTIEVALDVHHLDWQPRRATVYDDADRSTVRLAKAGDPK